MSDNDLIRRYLAEDEISRGEGTAETEAGAKQLEDLVRIKCQEAGKATGVELEVERKGLTVYWKGPSTLVNGLAEWLTAEFARIGALRQPEETIASSGGWFHHGLGKSPAGGES